MAAVTLGLSDLRLYADSISHLPSVNVEYMRIVVGRLVVTEGNFVGRLVAT